MMPKVSVIMNCLNGEKYLAEALASVKGQTFDDFEIIFWDNGSTDATVEIAKGYGPGLRYFRSEKTLPLGAARNRAIAEARGEYISFLDCDDLWQPEKLKKQMELMLANPKLGLVTTDTQIRSGDKTLYNLFEQSKPASGMAFRELLERQWISMSSALVRKSALDATRDPALQGAWFDENLNVCEEADVFYRLAYDYELGYVDEKLTVWRVHSGNTTFQKFGQFASETLAILDRMRRMYPGFEQDYSDIIRLLTKRAAFQRAIALWRAGQNGKAREIMAPFRNDSAKYRLFWLASYLPGSFFDLAAKIYFMLPKALRK